jgi:hypothetical protein
MFLNQWESNFREHCGAREFRINQRLIDMIELDEVRLVARGRKNFKIILFNISH